VLHDGSVECVSACDPVREYTSYAAIGAIAPLQCDACHSQCLLGCTGPGAHQCIIQEDARSCANYLLTTSPLGPSCVNSCPLDTYVDVFTATCEQCHEQCFSSPSDPRAGCSGPAPEDCRTCNNYREDGVCVSACSSPDAVLDGDECVPLCPSNKPFFADMNIANDVNHNVDVFPYTVCGQSCADVDEQMLVSQPLWPETQPVDANQPYLCTVTTYVAATQASTSGASDFYEDNALVITGVIVVLVAGITWTLVSHYYRSKYSGGKNALIHKVLAEHCVSNMRASMQLANVSVPIMPMPAAVSSSTPARASTSDFSYVMNNQEERLPPPSFVVDNGDGSTTTHI